MKAALCKSFDGIDGLTIEEITDPVPGPGECLIRVTAAGLNFLDTLMVRNRYQVKPDLPFSPAAEIAGIVAGVGPGVQRVRIGDRVAAFIGHGGAREKVVVREELLARVPMRVSDAVASGVAVTYGTAYHGLAERGRLAGGETVAVLGAAGGAGLAAVEIAKLLGARVIALASSEDKLAVARAHGADVAINYDAVDLRQALREAAGEGGVDVVYDCVGGDKAEPALRSLAWGGRYLVIGFAGGEIPRFALNLILLKSVDVVGVFWGKSTERDPVGHVRQLEELLGWCAEGKLAPRIHGTFPLARIQEALGVIERREAKGKVVLSL
ncbi:MAG: zinc-binding dehydrogenase [Rhizobiales bacterium]|nr:zinc-binding dehydrogenase [Hyphomicrobiales bacterium]